MKNFTESQREKMSNKITEPKIPTAFAHVVEKHGGEGALKAQQLWFARNPWALSPMTEEQAEKALKLLEKPELSSVDFFSAMRANLSKRK